MLKKLQGLSKHKKSGTLGHGNKMTTELKRLVSMNGQDILGDLKSVHILRTS